MYTERFFDFIAQRHKDANLTTMVVTGGQVGSDGKVTLKVWEGTDDMGLKAYTGNDTIDHFNGFILKNKTITFILDDHDQPGIPGTGTLIYRQTKQKTLLTRKV